MAKVVKQARITTNNNPPPPYVNVTATLEKIANGDDRLYTYMLERYVMRMESHIRELERSMAIMEQVNSKARRMIEAIRDAGVPIGG